MFVRNAVLLLSLSLLSACALTEDKVAIRYEAPANIHVVPGASQVTLQVTGVEGRASNRDRVSTKKNGYGMEMARILAENDVVAETAAAVESELKSLGFNIGPGGQQLKVELTTMYTDFKIGMFSGDAVGEVSFSLAARDSAGSFVYAKTYKAVKVNEGIMLASGSNAGIPLKVALREAVQQVASDADLHAALLKAGSAPVNAAVQQKPTS